MILPTNIHLTRRATDTRPNRLFNLAGTVLLLFAWVTAAAEERGLLWEVSKDQRTGWMLGAVHTGKPSYYPLRREIMTAFDGSTVLLVEMDESSVPAEQQQSILLRYSTYPAEDRLQNHLSKATLQQLTQTLGEFNIPVQAVENRLPAFVALMLTAMQSAEAGYLPQWGIDTHLMQAAKARTPPMEIRQIETFQQQISMLAKLPQDESIIQDTLKDMQGNLELWRDIEAAWRTGDIRLLTEKVLLEPLKEDPDQLPLYQLMFFDRNPNMAHAMQNCMATGESCFMVVGAGHLLGEEGVVRLLRQTGYTVTQK